MTLLIIALGMTATMGFYALHIAETETSKNKLIQQRAESIEGFASI